MKTPTVPTSRALLLSLPLGLLACSDIATNDFSTSGTRNDGATTQQCAGVEWPHRIGSLHEHSGFSDGAVGTTPADYFAAGADLGLDFVGSSEHSDNARLPLTADTDCVSPDLLQCIQLPPEGLLKWESTQDLAAAASNDSFTAFRGFEWTSDRFGHINVYFSTYDLNAKLGTGYLLSMADFAFWFTAPLTLGGGEDGIAVFNHPGREDIFHTACDNFGPLAEACGTVFNGDPAYTWNDFEYQQDLSERFVGIEMFGKASDYYDGDNGAPPSGWFAYALDKGWYLAPVGAEDEHGHQWAQPQRAKTVIIAADRSPDALKEAMRARRFYALAHSYSDVRLQFTAQLNGQTWPMGSQLNASEGSPLSLDIRVSGLEAPQIELVTVGGTVLRSESAGESRYTTSVTNPDAQWVFARVIDTADSDGDEKTNEVVAISAPIWFAASDTPSRCDQDTM